MATSMALLCLPLSVASHSVEGQYMRLLVMLAIHTGGFLYSIWDAIPCRLQATGVT